jgi:hypothetical protein
VTGIVHDDIETALLGDNFRDRRVDRCLRADIELERAQIDLMSRANFSTAATTSALRPLVSRIEA